MPLSIQKLGEFFMNQNDLNYVQIHIDYEFKNLDLLRQAFTRKSYSSENGGADNELLEFIGDKALDLVVVKYLSDNYGHLKSEEKGYNSKKERDGYVNQYDEGELTVIKSRLVQKKTLANRISTLGFEKYLIMGKSDIEGEVYKSQSVKEDLFEAIVGAVTIDSNWDMEKVFAVVDKMLEPDMELENTEDTENYIGEVQEWALSRYGELPKYHVDKYSQIWMYGKHYFADSTKALCYPQPKYMCYLGLPKINDIFIGFGMSRSEARRNAAQYTMEQLKRYKLELTIKDEIPNPNLDESINQLEILARRGYFAIPKYSFEETHDADGNPHWKSICLIEGRKDKTSGTSTKKMEAKKKAAYKMLCKVLKG